MCACVCLKIDYKYMSFEISEQKYIYNFVQLLLKQNSHGTI
jgi:hypothetical protein